MRDAEYATCPSMRTLNRAAGHGFANFREVRTEPMALENQACLRHPRRRNLHDRSEFFGKTRGDRIRLRAQGDVEPAMRGEGHFQQRHQQPTVGAVVIGQ